MALLAGKAVAVGTDPDAPVIQLAPAVTVPAVLVGGVSDVALDRAVRAGDGAFLLPVVPDVVAATRRRLDELAARAARPRPSITTGLLAAIDGDDALPDRAGDRVVLSVAAGDWCRQTELFAEAARRAT